MSVLYYTFAYKDVIDILQLFDDSYGILSYQYQQRRKILYGNPVLNTENLSKTFLYIAIDDRSKEDEIKSKKNVIGRCYYFPTRLLLCDTTEIVQSGSAVFVHEKYRQLAVGAEMFTHSTFSEDYNQRLYAGISPLALPIFKKLKYSIFTLKRLCFRKNYQPYLRQKGVIGRSLSYIAPIINNIALLPFFVNRKSKVLNQQYVVKQCETVPVWIDDMVLKDGHKYMEIHDHKWMQWQLMGAFRGGKENRQQFFAIYYNDHPVGFFLTKQRMLNKKHNVIMGSIVEWGSKDEKELSEAEIYELALETFEKDVYLIDIATNNEETISRMKKIGFIDGGEEHIIFKDNLNMCDNDIKDEKQWRLRYGYADVIFS